MKVQKSYRFHPVTVMQVAKIRQDTNLPADVDVVKVAIDRLYQSYNTEECWEALGKIKRAENAEDEQNRSD